MSDSQTARPDETSVEEMRLAVAQYGHENHFRTEALQHVVLGSKGGIKISDQQIKSLYTQIKRRGQL